MNLHNERVAEVAERYARECDCASNVSPCAGCWKIAIAAVARFAKALPRYTRTCTCAGGTPCTKCWEAAEADVDGYYRAVEDSNPDPCGPPCFQDRCRHHSDLTLQEHVTAPALRSAGSDMNEMRYLGATSKILGCEGRESNPLCLSALDYEPRLRPVHVLAQLAHKLFCTAARCQAVFVRPPLSRCAFMRYLDPGGSR